MSMFDDVAQYGVASYGNMMRDKVRMGAFEAALRQAVTPDSVVLDIGTGTGIMAMMAVQFGAKHVYAVEPAGAITVAQKIAQANGMAEKITFIQDISTCISLPEPVDVIVSDLRGVLPLLQHHIATIADARTRLLAPDGILIPQQDTLWAAVVDNEKSYTTLTQPWASSPYGLDMTVALDSVLNSWLAAKVEPEQLLVKPQKWVTLDYTSRTEANVKGTLEFEVTCPGRGHGLLVWFDMQLADGIGISNAPGVKERAEVYGSGFFPWKSPVELAVGDNVTVKLQAFLVGGEYTWRWQSEIRRGNELVAQYNQSTFFATPLAKSALRTQESGYVAQPTPDSYIDQFILSQLDGQQTVQMVAKTVAEAFPARFNGWEMASGRVSALIKRYGL